MDDLRKEVLERVRAERFGGISAYWIAYELTATHGKSHCTQEAVQAALESLIAAGLVYEVEPAEYAEVRQPEPLRPTVVSKIRGIGKTGQKSLF